MSFANVLRQTTMTKMLCGIMMGARALQSFSPDLEVSSTASNLCILGQALRCLSFIRKVGVIM